MLVGSGLLVQVFRAMFPGMGFAGLGVGQGGGMLGGVSRGLLVGIYWVGWVGLVLWIISLTGLTLRVSYVTKARDVYASKNAAKRSRQHARIQRRLSSNERTHTRGDAPTIYPNKRTHIFS